MVLSVPSGSVPAFQRTKPPWRLRQAEPEPRRAAMERESRESRDSAGDETAGGFLLSGSSRP